MEPVLQLDNLTVNLAGRRILDGLTCTLRGRTIGLLGPNGAGKSTLINTLLGFYPASGSGRVLGHDIARQSKRIRQLVGYMPENDCFVGNMSAVGFVKLMAELSGLPEEAALEGVPDESLYYVGLGEARYRQVSTYSLGMKQLAKLAQAIVHGPRLLILDEPTNGLDPSARQRIRLVKEMRDSGETRIILCSHLLRDVEETCEEVLILKHGRIVHLSNLEEERRLNRRFLELEIHGPPDGFADAARQLGCECDMGSNGRAKLVLADGVEIRDIYGIADRSGLQIRRLSHRRDTLEDIFLKAMETGGSANGRL